METKILLENGTNEFLWHQCGKNKRNYSIFAGDACTQRASECRRYFYAA